jgi:hypothetical protein
LAGAFAFFADALASPRPPSWTASLFLFTMIVGA